ncbi:MAG: hypothetical protein AB7E95_07735 [Kiritimatiellales bacterium]
MNVEHAQKLQMLARQTAIQYVERDGKRVPKIPENAVILDSFKTVSFMRNTVFAPVPISTWLEDAKWKRSKTISAVDSRINNIQRAIGDGRSPVCDEVLLTRVGNFAVLIIGRENVARFRPIQDRFRKVTLSFEGVVKKKGQLQPFTNGDAVKLEVNSQEEGYIYLWSIGPDSVIQAIYPDEGEKSAIRVSQNNDRKLTEKINDYRATKSKGSLRFFEDKSGPARIVAMVIKKPLPVCLAHLLERFPEPVLFAHQHVYRGGMGGEASVNSTNDFSALPDNQISFGVLDYYFQP